MYQNLYDLIHQYIYGGVTMTADMELTATIISTIGCVFLFALPFMIVKKILDFILP